MKFIYGIVTGGAEILVRNIFEIPQELEVLEAGGEEGGVGERVEVVVSHGDRVRREGGGLLNDRPELLT